MTEPTSLPFQKADVSKMNITRNGDNIVDTPKDEPKDDVPVTTDTTTGKTDATASAATDKPVDKPVDSTTGGTTSTDKPVDEPPANATNTTPEGEYTEEQWYEDVDNLIAESTGGALRSIEDLPTILEENARLKAELANKEPEFPNPAAKLVYDIATKAVGAELGTARQLLHVYSLDLEKMTPKEKQFEAFCLERPNLTQEDARKRFEAVYEKTYSDLENDLVQLDSHDLATRNAEVKIKEHRKALDEAVKQSGKTAPTGPTPEEIEAVDSQLESALSEFGGVSLKFDDSQYGKLDIPMDQGKAQQFMDILKNPHKLIDNIADSCRDASGRLVLNDFVREMYLLFDRDRISQQERDHLMKLGKVAQIQEQKNTPKKDIVEQTTPQTKPSFRESFAGAVKSAGMVN